MCDYNCCLVIRGRQMRYILYHFFFLCKNFQIVKCSIKQVCLWKIRLPQAGSIDRTGNNVLSPSSRENILLAGMGADLSRPVVPSESRLRSCDVSDVIVIIGIIMCHVAWSASHCKSPRMSWAVCTIMLMHMNTCRKPEPCSARHVTE